MEKYVPMTEASCYILLSIYKGDKHGYAIMQHIKEMTQQGISISNGTLYGVLNRMVADGLLETYNFEDKKVYRICDRGKEVLKLEKNRLKAILKNFEGS